MPTVSEVLAEVSKGERVALVDLANDPHMDPDGDDVSLAYEYAVVFGGEQETPDCIRLDYEGGCCGFPPDHVLTDVTYHDPSAVYGRQSRQGQPVGDSVTVDLDDDEQDGAPTTLTVSFDSNGNSYTRI